MLGFVIAMASASSVTSRSPDRPVVRVACSGAALPDGELWALCQHMVQSLAQVAPRAAFRLVPTSDWAPLRTQDVSVGLHVTDSQGVLSWQIGSEGAVRIGPTLPFYAQMVASGARAMRGFTDSLVASAHIMVAEMKAVFANPEK